MLFNDPMHDGEAQAGTFLFGGEEGFKYTLKILFGDAGARVGYSD